PLVLLFPPPPPPLRTPLFPYTTLFRSEPGAARGHQVRREDLLRGVLRLHQIGARAADELRHDHPLGAVDDVGAPLDHHREVPHEDRKSTRLNSSHVAISYAVFCLKKKN